MNQELTKIFNAMTSDPKVGITIRPSLGELLRRKNVKERPHRPTFFLSSDVLSSGLTFPMFINELLTEHGTLIITPRREHGSGVKRIDGLDPIRVEKPNANNQSQPLVTNTQPAVMSQENSHANTAGMNAAAFGMNAVQYGKMLSQVERSEDYRRDAERYRDKIEHLETKIENLKETSNAKYEALVIEKRNLQTEYDSLKKQFELDLQIEKANQAKGMNSPMAATITKTLIPVLAKLAGSGAAGAATQDAGYVEGMGASNEISKNKQKLIETIATTDMDDGAVALLEMVGARMGNEKFVQEISNLISIHDVV